MYIFASENKQMKHILPLIISTLVFTVAHAATGDTTIILSHTLSNLASPPSNDDVWTVFPNTGTTYQKIIMKFTLGCGTPNCSGWDYTVNASLGKKDGTLDSAIVAIDTLTLDTTWSYSDHVNFMEVGRLITPYGTYMANNSNGFNNSWTHPYYYDVTDYASILKDSVNVRVYYDGWTDAFSAKVEFLMVEGTPSRTVESVREVYNTYMGYPNSAGFESVAIPKIFPIANNVTSAKVVLIMTGHGSQGEFDPHSFQIKANSLEVAARLLWKDDCGMVAIAPQGGTWIFNRANWCPGEKVPIIEADLTPFITPGQNVTLDLDFDDYTIQQGESAGYGVSMHLITYTNQPNNDVAMEEIIAPNNDKNYLRFNPISTKPIVKIKNTGKLPLTKTLITYWVKGGVPCYYEWNGYLPTYETSIITLPPFDWTGLDTTDKVFFAEVSFPNLVADEYTPNNLLSSSFNLPPMIDSAFFTLFKTNNHPEENSYLLRNEWGDTILFRNNFANNAFNRDTFYLEHGSYSFDLYDYDSQWEGGDGISWWLNTQQGWETSGQFSLRKLNNVIIRNFNGDFGSNIHYEFTVGYPLGYGSGKPACIYPLSLNETNAENSRMNIFPNPATDIVSIEWIDVAADGILKVSDVSGKVYQQHAIKNTHQKFELTTKNFPNGVYLVEFAGKGNRMVKKLIVTK